MIILQIKIAVCDYNESCIHSLKLLIKEYADGLLENTFMVYTYKSGEKMFDESKHIIPDIIFMDIDLNEKYLGTSIGAKIKTINPNILLIYISGYDFYYNELVQAEPFAFLSKPVESNELYEVLNRASKRLYQTKQEFWFTYITNRITNKIDLKKVMYFESQHRIINMYDQKGNIIPFYQKLDLVEKEIEQIYPYFLRPNKSYYANYNYIESFTDTYILINSKKINISSRYKKKYDEKRFLLL